MPFFKGNEVHLLPNGQTFFDDLFHHIRRATESLQERFFNVPVEEVMTRTPVCVPPTMKLGEILNKLNNHKIHAVLVVNEEQQLLGIVDNFRCMM